MYKTVHLLIWDWQTEMFLSLAKPSGKYVSLFCFGFGMLSPKAIKKIEIYSHNLNAGLEQYFFVQLYVFMSGYWIIQSYWKPDMISFMNRSLCIIMNEFKGLISLKSGNQNKGCPFRMTLNRCFRRCPYEAPKITNST